MCGVTLSVHPHAWQVSIVMGMMGAGRFLHVCGICFVFEGVAFELGDIGGGRFINRRVLTRSSLKYRQLVQLVLKIMLTLLDFRFGFYSHFLGLDRGEEELVFFELGIILSPGDPDLFFISVIRFPDRDAKLFC